MTESVLIITQTRLSDTEAIVQAIRETFNEPDIIIYAIGRKRIDFTKKINRLDVDEVVYDYDVSKGRPEAANREYLRKAEQSFTEPAALNTCISADRKIIKNGQVGLFNEEKSQFGYEETLCHVEARIRALEDLFEDRDLRFVFARRAEVLAGMVAYQLSKREGIPFFRRNFTRIKDKYILNDNPYDYSEWFNKEYQKALFEGEEYPTYKEAIEHLEAVRNGDSLYDVPDSPWSNRLSMSEKLTYLSNLIRNERGGITVDYYYDTPKLKYFHKILYKKFNKFYLNKKYNDKGIHQLPDKYVFFPIHAQPELALMLFTKYFTDQREVIKYVAKSLPIDHQLVVKDHPVSWGQRSDSYYQALENVYNISIVHPKTNIHELILGASAVVTITGTAGIESLAHDTPVVTFGRENHAPFYANFSSVITIENIYDISKSIEEAIGTDIYEKELISYIATSLRVGSSRSSDMYSNLFSQLHSNYNWHVSREG